MKSPQQILTAALICIGFIGMAVAGASTPAKLTIMDDPSRGTLSEQETRGAFAFASLP